MTFVIILVSFCFLLQNDHSYSDMIQLGDTIGAISTPPGKGGIGIIRMSGPGAVDVADKIFKGKIMPSAAGERSIHYGICASPANGEMLDEVMLLVLRAPRTYTREDVIEIHTHGNMQIMNSILEEMYRLGVRPADPGEFTMRAFMNGRLDLTQAEAVADLIDSKTEEARKAALSQISGKLSEEINSLRLRLIANYAMFEAEIDFYEEDIEIVSRKKAISEIEQIASGISGLIDTFNIGRIIREGASIGLFGVVNAGKSSIFNAIVGKDRAIVHNEPGTTRDTIESSVPIDGILCRFHDTAGFREETGYVESEGIKRSTQLMDEIDLALLVLDGQTRKYREEQRIYKLLREHLGGGGRIIVVHNKIDVSGEGEEKSFRDYNGSTIVHTSGLRCWGIEGIRKAISKSLHSGGQAYTSGLIITNSRHHFLLTSALKVLERMIESIRAGISGEFLALDFREAIDCLGTITGESIGDQVLHEIFSRFCIGK